MTEQDDGTLRLHAKTELQGHTWEHQSPKLNLVNHESGDRWRAE